MSENKAKILKNMSSMEKSSQELFILLDNMLVEANPDVSILV